jgi:Ca2+-binding EF-hand superfamily protein
MIAAPAVLSALDKNGDGKLTAEEFGTTKELMRWDPLLCALDANHNGEISASEIRDAERELEQLEQNRDGVLEGPEFVPDYVNAAVLRVFARLDLNHDGRIEAQEWKGSAGDPFRSLLTAADTDSDGDITVVEITNEIFHRADNDRDGIVTRWEMDAAMRSGALGPFFRPAGL